jgi:hypothetical protein
MLTTRSTGSVVWPKQSEQERAPSKQDIITANARFCITWESPRWFRNDVGSKTAPIIHPFRVLHRDCETIVIRAAPNSPRSGGWRILAAAVLNRSCPCFAGFAKLGTHGPRSDVGGNPRAGGTFPRPDVVLLMVGNLLAKTDRNGNAIQLSQPSGGTHGRSSPFLKIRLGALNRAGTTWAAAGFECRNTPESRVDGCASAPDETPLDAGIGLPQAKLRLGLRISWILDPQARVFVSQG